MGTIVPPKSAVPPFPPTKCLIGIGVKGRRHGKVVAVYDHYGCVSGNVHQCCCLLLMAPRVQTRNDYTVYLHEPKGREMIEDGVVDYKIGIAADGVLLMLQTPGAIAALREEFPQNASPGRHSWAGDTLEVHTTLTSVTKQLLDSLGFLGHRI